VDNGSRGQQKEYSGAKYIFDPDEVTRRVPLTFPGGEKPAPRWRWNGVSALNTEPTLAEDGSVTLADYRIPGGYEYADFEFRRGRQRVPRFVRRSCGPVSSATYGFFHREFADKVVIFGTTAQFAR